MRRWPAPTIPFVLLSLSGCAAGTSLSLSQAPLSLVVTDGDSYEIAARDDGTQQALADRGDFQTGIPGYQAMAGNALLPVPAVQVTLAPAAVSNLAIANALQSQVATAPLLAPPVTPAVPLTAAPAQALETAVPLLGKTIPAVVATPASAVTDLLPAIAAQLTRGCKRPLCG